MTETVQPPVQAETTHVGTPEPEAKLDSSSGEAEQQAEQQVTEAKPPETPAPSWEGFSLKAPEGHDADTVNAVAEALKAKGLTPTAAQEFLDQVAPVMQERQMASLNAIHEDWIKQSKADKLIGGAKYEENLAIAKSAVDAYGDDELRTLLKPISEGGQGLGNIPAIQRVFFRFGKTLETGTNVVRGRAPMAEADRAKQLYANSNMK